MNLHASLKQRNLVSWAYRPLIEFCEKFLISCYLTFTIKRYGKNSGSPAKPPPLLILGRDSAVHPTRTFKIAFSVLPTSCQHCFLFFFYHLIASASAALGGNDWLFASLDMSHLLVAERCHRTTLQGICRQCGVVQQSLIPGEHKNQSCALIANPTFAFRLHWRTNTPTLEYSRELHYERPVRISNSASRPRQNAWLSGDPTSSSRDHTSSYRDNHRVNIYNNNPTRQHAYCYKHTSCRGRELSSL